LHHSRAVLRLLLLLPLALFWLKEFRRISRKQDVEKSVCSQ